MMMVQAYWLAVNSARHEMLDELARAEHQTARRHDFGNIIECALPADVGRLLPFVQLAHIHAVAGDVVRGAAETDDGEEGDGNGEEIGQAQGERHQPEGDARDHLREHHPKLLGLEQFEERAP